MFMVFTQGAALSKILLSPLFLILIKKSEIVLSSIHIEIINTYANHISYEIEQAFWLVS